MLNIDDRLIKEVLPKIKPNGLAVLLAISIHLNKESGVCFPSHERLMRFTGLGSESIYNALRALKKEGLLVSSQSIDSKNKTFSRRTFKVNTDLIHIWVTAKNAEPLEEKPLTDFPHTAQPDAVEPHTANHETYPLNQSEQLNNLEQLNKGGEGNAPTENQSDFKEEKKESPKVALKGSCPGEGFEVCKNCGGDGYDPYPNHSTTSFVCLHCLGSGWVLPITKTITYPAATPKQWREASKEIRPIARAETILEAEAKILNWAKTEGLETLKFRHGTAKRKFNEDELPALVAHYVSVFASTNEGSRANLMRDPVANFEAGLFKYLTMQNTIDRNNNTKPGTHAQQPGQTITSNMRIL